MEIISSIHEYKHLYQLISHLILNAIIKPTSQTTNLVIKKIIGALRDNENNP